jgi:hypothetical protein
VKIGFVSSNRWRAAGVHLNIRSNNWVRFVKSTWVARRDMNGRTDHWVRFVIFIPAVDLHGLGDRPETEHSSTIDTKVDGVLSDWRKPNRDSIKATTLASTSSWGSNNP